MFVIYKLHLHVVGLDIVAGSQLRACVWEWLSPPDPSTNHNIACGAHHKGTAAWFFQGSVFTEWKSAGSLLWIHGKRMFVYSFRLYTISWL